MLRRMVLRTSSRVAAAGVSQPSTPDSAHTVLSEQVRGMGQSAMSPQQSPGQSTTLTHGTHRVQGFSQQIQTASAEQARGVAWREFTRALTALRDGLRASEHHHITTHQESTSTPSELLSETASTPVFLSELGLTELQDVTGTDQAPAGDALERVSESELLNDAVWRARPLAHRTVRAALHARIAPEHIVSRLAELLAHSHPASPSWDRDEHLLRMLSQLLDDASLEALLRAQSERLDGHVEFSRQRLRDSRSPAALKHISATHTAQASGDGGILYGEASTLQLQLLREHRAAARLLLLVEERIAHELATIASGHRREVPRMPLVSAGMRLCRSLQGGQGAARAGQWARAALASVQTAFDRLEKDGDSNSDAAAAAGSALRDLVRGPLIDCCVDALEAPVGAAGAVYLGAAQAFSEDLALVMECLSLVQRQSEGRGVGESSSAEEAVTQHADVTLRLCAALFHRVGAARYTAGFAPLRNMFTGVLTETDVGYEADSTTLAHDGFCALLGCLARVELDPATRHSILEDTFRTVMLNSREDVWQSEAVHEGVFAVLSVIAGSAGEGATASCAGGVPPEVHEPKRGHQQHGVRAARALCLFNTLYSPQTRALAVREGVLGRMILSSPVAEAGDDVARLLNFHAQRLPLSMDTAHALAVKLLLRDALRAQKGNDVTAGPQADTSSSIYLVLDVAVDSQRDRHDAQPARTLFLRLLTLYRDLVTSSPTAFLGDAEEEAASRDQHMAATVRAWLDSLSAARVNTLSITCVELLLELSERLREIAEVSGAGQWRETRELLMTTAQTLAVRLVAATPVDVVTPARRRKGENTSGRVASTLWRVDAPTGGDVSPTLRFPAEFCVAACVDGGVASTPPVWTPADVHHFLEDVLRLCRERGARLYLSDFCALLRLDTYSQRYGHTQVFTPDNAGCVGVLAAVPPRLVRATEVDAESALGTRLPRSVSPFQTTTTNGSGARLHEQDTTLTVCAWIERWLREDGDVAGDGVVGGGEVGLSSFPSLFHDIVRHQVLPAYVAELGSIAGADVRNTSSADADGEEAPEADAETSLQAQATPSGMDDRKIFFTVRQAS